MKCLENKIKSNQHGFTIMEVIILASVGLVSILAFSTYVASQKAGAREVVQNIEGAAIQSMIAEIVTDPTACLNNFNGMNTSVLTSRADVRDASNAVRIDTSTPFRGGNLSFLRLEKLPAVPILPPNGQGEVRMSIILNKKGTSAGAKEMQFILPLQVRVDAARNVIYCAASFGNSGAQCVYPVSTCNCTTQTVSCPVGYRVTGGGMYDGGMGKGRYYSFPVNPPGGANGTGGWTCGTNNRNSQRCYAVCCL